MENNWIKQGILFRVEDYTNEQIHSHASIPYAHQLKDDNYRIYFSSRNSEGKSLPFFIDCLICNGNIKILNEPVGPLLKFGNMGTFDDSGIMPSCIVVNNRQFYMYYIGWNPEVTVSYRLAIGLAFSKDNGLSFEKYSEGPICDRDLNEPYFNTAPFVIIEDGKWKMWYISCTKWHIINNYPEPQYHIKYCESTDGVHWQKQGIVCLDYDVNAQALGRPCVIKEKGIYKMYFSFRQIEDYRNVPRKGYQIGLAESEDGIHWEKKYNETGIVLSETGWDSNMMEYCHVFSHKNYSYMIYNGNDFGEKGFGYAIK